ncbi:MAG: DNA-binding protein WhiA [Coriobacteriia bacterium]|nr:DNA-binding protein WhiA [Coriobacteriia bacterium]
MTKKKSKKKREAQEREARALRNTVNRLVNAEIANQNKAIYASIEQIEMIKKLDAQQGLDTLPPALAEFARLRLANPGLSLKELGEIADPPLSKSAINHRMRRIQALL